MEPRAPSEGFNLLAHEPHGTLLPFFLSQFELDAQIRNIQAQSGQRYWDYVQSLVLLVQTGGNPEPCPGVLCGFCGFCSQFATFYCESRTHFFLQERILGT